MPSFASLIAATVCLAGLTASAAAAEPAEKFVPLFNGQNLDGWEGDAAVWHVEGGEIVGSSDDKKIPANSFLVTKKHYKNFVLRLKFKLRNHNSGVQFRGQVHKDYRVTGYQADITDDESMAMLYDEGGRGTLQRLAPEETARHVHKDGWNDYVIRADGPHITLVLNGFTTVDYTEKPGQGATEGIIALQVHDGPPTRVEFKDVEIAELP